MYNIFQKQIYIKHYNIIRASHGQLTSSNNNNKKFQKFIFKRVSIHQSVFSIGKD